MVWVLILENVTSLRILGRRHEPDSYESYRNHDKILRRVLESLANTKAYLTGDRRNPRLTAQDLANARNVVKGLSQKITPKQLDQFLSKTMDNIKQRPLRQGEAVYDKMVERELKHTMQRQSVALLDKPRVEAQGRHDFLVIDTDVHDPFVTVIPNNIYYDIEKKCANWLDDCSLQGIRSRLLEKVRSPFR